MEIEPKKFLKYFEVTLNESRDWVLKDWILFVLETFYETLLPFIAGAMLVARQQILWVVFLILPISIRLKIAKKGDKKVKKYFL